MKSGLLLAALLMCALSSRAEDFGTKGGPEPANIHEFANFLKQDPSDLPSAPCQALTPR